jgi:hypothetical protein
MEVKSKKKLIEFNLLGKYKEVIYNNLFNSLNVGELVLGENNPSGNLNEHIYDTIYLDATKLAEKTYVLLDTKITKSDNTIIKRIDILINVFTSYSKINLSPTEKSKYSALNFYGNRVDILIDILIRSITDMNIGIGKIALAPINPVKLIHPSDNHYGKQIELQIYDF